MIAAPSTYPIKSRPWPESRRDVWVRLGRATGRCRCPSERQRHRLLCDYVRLAAPQAFADHCIV